MVVPAANNVEERARRLLKASDLSRNAFRGDGIQHTLLEEIARPLLKANNLNHNAL